MKFTLSLIMIIGNTMQTPCPVALAVTAMPLPAGGVEVLRVEAYDQRTKTFHMLPEFLVDLLTEDAATKEWLEHEVTERLANTKAA